MILKIFLTVKINKKNHFNQHQFLNCKIHSFFNNFWIRLLILRNCVKPWRKVFNGETKETDLFSCSDEKSNKIFDGFMKCLSIEFSLNSPLIDKKKLKKTMNESSCVSSLFYAVSTCCSFICPSLLIHKWIVQLTASFHLKKISKRLLEIFFCNLQSLLKFAHM